MDCAGRGEGLTIRADRGRSNFGAGDLCLGGHGDVRFGELLQANSNAVECAEKVPPTPRPGMLRVRRQTDRLPPATAGSTGADRTRHVLVRRNDTRAVPAWRTAGWCPPLDEVCACSRPGNALPGRHGRIFLRYRRPPINRPLLSRALWRRKGRRVHVRGSSGTPTSCRRTRIAVSARTARHLLATPEGRAAAKPGASGFHSVGLVRSHPRKPPTRRLLKHKPSTRGLQRGGTGEPGVSR